MTLRCERGGRHFNQALPRPGSTAAIGRFCCGNDAAADAELGQSTAGVSQAKGGLVSSVSLRGLTKRFGSAVALDNVSLEIEHGKLVCLLGPSGCGKTTALRLVAGFVEPTAGEIAIGDRVVSSPRRTLQPERRNVSMVFQSYALWPHMTVAENVAYGLTLRKIDRDTHPPQG